MTATDLNSIYARLQSGDKSARDELIIEARAVARSAVGKFLMRNFDAQHLRDDLYGEAMVALVRTVDSIATERPTLENVAAYLRLSVTNACSDYLDGSKMVAPKARQRQRDRAAGRPDRAARVCTFNDRSHGRESNKDRLLSDILDSCMSDDERQVVTLRAQGLTDAEIASNLGNLSRSEVNRIRKRVEQSYLSTGGSLAS